MKKHSGKALTKHMPKAPSGKMEGTKGGHTPRKTAPSPRSIPRS